MSDKPKRVKRIALPDPETFVPVTCRICGVPIGGILSPTLAKRVAATCAQCRKLTTATSRISP